MLKQAVCSSILLAMAAGSAAAQPWREPLEKWSEADAKRVLSKSPWARRASSTVRASEYDGRGPAPGDFLVRWESALPVRQAHQRAGSALPLPAEQGGYTITITGSFPRGAETAEAELQYCDGTPARAKAVQVLPHPGGQMMVLRFAAAEGIRQPGLFRLPMGIRTKANDFRLMVRIGGWELRQRFSLRDMLYLRHLEL